MVIADGRAVRYDNVLVNNGFPDFCTSTYGNVLEEDRVLHQAVTVDLAPGADYRSPDGSATVDAAGADIGVDVLSAALIVVKYGLCRGKISLVGQYGPLVVIQVKLG